MIVEKNGLKWFVRDNVKADLEPIRVLESHVLLACRFLSNPNKVFVDVGSHVGKFAIRLAKFNKKVIAYEPIPENVEVLRENVKINGLNNVEIRQKAVGSFNGKVKMKPRYAQSHVASDGVEVDIVTLDDDLSNESVEIGLIKVDVEGYELEVIKGAIGITKKHKPHWIIEHHEYWGSNEPKTHKDIAEILINFGYLPFAIDTTHWLYIHRDRLDNDAMDLLEFMFGHHVFYTWIVPNMQSGKSWYFGIPHNWWHGASILEFIHNIPSPLSDKGKEYEIDKLYVKTIERALGLKVKL